MTRSTSSRGVGPVVAVVGVMVSGSIPPFLVGALSVHIGTSFPFATTEVGLAVGAYYLVSALLSPLAGHAVNAHGPATALRLSCLGSSLGLVAIALAHSTAVVVIALAALGIPNAAIQPAANHILATARDTRRRGLSFGLVQSAIPTATLCAGLALWLVRDDAWRPAVWIVVGLTLVAQLPIRYVSGLGTEGGAASVPRFDAGPARGPGPRPHRSVDATLCWLAGCAFFASMAATALPSFVADTGHYHHVSPSLVALTQTAASLSCIAARVIVAWRCGTSAGPRVTGVVASALVVGAVGYQLLAFAQVWSFVVGAVVAYAFGWGWNGVFNLAVSRVRPDNVASATGLTQAGVFLGGVSGPPIFAAVSTSADMGAGWMVMVGAALAGAGCSLAARWSWRAKWRVTRSVALSEHSGQ